MCDLEPFSEIRSHIIIIKEVSQVQACEDDTWQNYLLPYPGKS